MFVYIYLCVCVCMCVYINNLAHNNGSICYVCEVSMELRYAGEISLTKFPEDLHESSQILKTVPKSTYEKLVTIYKPNVWKNHCFVDCIYYLTNFVTRVVF